MRIASIIILGWLESALWSSLEAVAVSSVNIWSLWRFFLSFFGSQDLCNAAPKKLQIKLAVLHFTGVAVFSVVQRSEMVGTFSAALSKGNYQAHKQFKHFSLACFTLESKKSSFHCAGSAVNSVDHPVLKVKDNVLFIREVGVLEVMHIVNTIHPNQD